MTPDEAITIVTTTSPIPSHPDTWIVDTTYASVRHHLPKARWLFLFDGVRPEQEDLRAGYDEYKRKLFERVENGEWTNTDYLRFGVYTHQAGMCRTAILSGCIKTPLIMWIEHDFPLNEKTIDWQGIVDTLIHNELHYIRFALPEENWISIRRAHANLEEFHTTHGVPVMRIMNFTSLPHVARLNFYERLMKEFVTGRIHLECHATESVPYAEREWSLALYTPPGDLDRFYSLDGRAGPVKLPMEL
jgi:hypothetical protein